MKPEDITLDEIYAKKAEFRRMGMAGFRINNMSEDESMRQYIAESWSICFCAVRDPYHGVRGKKSKNIRFRVFQIVKEKPMIPMGYSGMPSFNFECHDGKPMKKAIAIMKKNFGEKYKYKISDDYITCSPILSQAELEKKGEEERKEKQSYEIQENDSEEVRALKLKIKKLEALSSRMKEANKAIKKNDDNKLIGLGFSHSEIESLKEPDFCGRLGFPDYELTSLSSKVRRLKSKLR